ncbi:MAG TPA: polysaccharide deacetylase family protein [Negativicutes bacterium]|nr:polysaccharide deacetylase family protein [Negativicutes bacterium]
MRKILSLRGEAMRTRRLLLPALVIAAAVMVNTRSELWEDRRVVTRVPTTVPAIALTLDDGPHYKMTPEILAVLKDKGVRVTFFVLGENVDRSPDLLAREVADGHEVAVHGYHHASLARLDKAHVTAELANTERAIGREAGKPALFRPPGGSYNDTVFSAARERGYTMVLWDIDPHDWARPPVDNVVGTVLRRAAPGSIVLLHDGQYPLPTAKALAIIIDRLRAEGYELVTVSELLQLYERRPAQLGIY